MIRVIWPVLTAVLASSAATLADDVVSDVAASESAPVTQAFAMPERTPHHGVDKNLFQGHSWYTPPPAPPKREIVAPVPRAPVAPPLPFKLLGSFEQAGGPTMYYLVKGDRIYDVKIGDTLDETYQVDGVSEGELKFTYLPLSTSQSLRLGEK
ncbi:MAG: hypothetical protein OEY74_00130 [Gammaproteobacteria bacterium]|nr:hypothetical protein [Gammaproteobacteria bacterium]